MDDKCLWKRYVDHIQNRVNINVQSNATTDSSHSTEIESPLIPFISSAESEQSVEEL